MLLRRILPLWAPLMAALASAQALPSTSTTPTTSTPTTSTTSAAAQTHTITVGDLAHKYAPDNITANAGDIILFQFFLSNHSVVRAADLKSPCIPYELSGANRVGFFSGFHSSDVIKDNPDEFRLPINDSTTPIYFYCSAPGSCIDYQMVGIINPKNADDIETLRDNAKNSPFMLQPWEKFPAEGTSTSSSSLPTTATSTASSTSTSQAASSQTAAPAAKHSGLSTGATIGIAVGSAAVALILAALFFFMWRSRRLAKKVKYGSVNNSGQQPPSGQSDPSKGAPIVDGDTIYVPVKRVDYRNSGMTSQYGDAPPYDNATIRTDDLNTPYSRTTSPGLPQAHHHYGQQNMGHPERYSDMTNISEAYAPYPPQTKLDSGPHEMATPEMMERRTNNDR